MKFGEFIKEKILLILLVLFIITSSEILLLPYPQIEIFVRLYIAICPIIIISIDIIIEYRKKNNFYKELKNNLEKLDSKYLISEIINTPDFIEGKILKNTIQETGKSMLENVNSYKQLQEDYKEYIELWIHEIKIPIATSKLIIENNKNEITKSIDEELDEIENYTEQALFYARSNTVNKDYVVTKSNLKEIVNGAILKNKRALLSNKISIELNDLEKEVFTDSKWATFIINQIIQNSIKYSKKEGKKVEIYTKANIKIKGYNMEKDEEKTVKLENDQEKNIGEIKEETQEEVRQTRKSRREKTKEDKRKITFIIIMAVLICVVSVFSVIFAMLNIKNTNILSGIYVLNIDVSNMTKEEALKKIDNIINEKLTSDITLKYNDYETIVNNSQFGIQFDNQKAISNAYNVGKENNIVVNNYKILFAKLHKINIEPELIINSETLQNKIREISAKLPNAVVENSYYIEGNKLIIVKGKRRK